MEGLDIQPNWTVTVVLTACKLRAWQTGAACRQLVMNACCPALDRSSVACGQAGSGGMALICEEVPSIRSGANNTVAQHLLSVLPIALQIQWRSRSAAAFTSGRSRRKESGSDRELRLAGIAGRYWP